MHLEYGCVSSSWGMVGNAWDPETTRRITVVHPYQKQSGPILIVVENLVPIYFNIYEYIYVAILREM